MATKAQKEKLERLRKLFRKDLVKLRTDYENLEIANKAGIDPGNLSSYASGKNKQPGMKILKKFYDAFYGELENPFDKIDNMENNKVNNDQRDDPKGQKKTNGPKENSEYDHDDISSNKTEDPEVIPLYKDDAVGRTNELIATLKTDNAHLRTVNNKLLDNGDKIFALPYKYLDSIDKIVATHDKSNQAVLNMTEIHQKIIDSYLRQTGGEK